MKKILFLGAMAILLMTSCHKDCVCKYYRSGKMYDIKVWDDKHITAEDCESMNDSYSLDIPIGEYGDVELTDMKVVCTQE